MEIGIRLNSIQNSPGDALKNSVIFRTNMIIKTKLTKQDFIKLNFTMLYRKPVIIIFTFFIGLLFLLGVAGLLFSNIDTSSQVAISFTMLIFLPVTTYINSIKNFKASNRITEPFEYSFEDTQLSIKGESFSVQLSWDKIHKVTLLKNWLLVWQSKQLANPIVRRDIGEGQIKELKQFLDRVKVKNNL